MVTATARLGETIWSVPVASINTQSAAGRSPTTVPGIAHGVPARMGINVATPDQMFVSYRGFWERPSTWVAGGIGVGALILGVVLGRVTKKL